MTLSDPFQCTTHMHIFFIIDHALIIAEVWTFWRSVGIFVHDVGDLRRLQIMCFIIKKRRWTHFS